RPLSFSLFMKEHDKSGEKEETFISHLVELPDRLIKATIALLFVTLCLATWASEIYDVLAQSMMASLPEGSKMIATGVITPFLTPLKVTLLVAFIVALPWILYHFWAFLAPGLYTHEKKLVLPLVVSSSL